MSWQGMVALVTHVTTDPYRVSLSQEDGIWLIEAVDLQGVRSFGRTVREAASNIREAIAAAEDLDHWEELDLAFALANERASIALKEFREADAAESQALAERERALTWAIQELRAQGMSYRDIGTILGLSHQRVAQIDAGTPV